METYTPAAITRCPHHQVEERRTHLPPFLGILCTRSGSASDPDDITPDLEGTATSGSMVGCGQEMTTELEEVVDLAMAGEGALGVPWRLEPLHLPFSPPHRLVRDLGPIVEVAASPVLDPGRIFRLAAA